MIKIYQWMGGCALAVLVSVPAQADLLMESQTKFGGIGGMGASETLAVTKIRGMKKRDDASFKFTGAIMGKLTGGPQQSTTITRLDKDVVWTFQGKDKKYTETSLSEIKEKSMAGEKKSRKEKSHVRIVRSEFSVKKTGAKKSINGFSCEEYVVTWLVETEDTESKSRSTSTMTTHLWNTPETPEIKKAVAEEIAFSQAYLKKLGMDVSADEMKKFGFGAFLPLGGTDDPEAAKNMENLKKEMAKAKGFPIVVDVKWEMEGQKEAAAAQQEKKPQPEAQEEEGGGIDIKGGAGGMFGSLVKKAVEKKAEDKPRERAEKEEGKHSFSSYTEIKKIQVVGLLDSEFDIPAGYEKK